MLKHRLTLELEKLKMKNQAEKKKAVMATGAGALGGAATSTALGGMGLAVGGTAVSVGLLPVTAAGAVVGLAGYGLYRALKKK